MAEKEMASKRRSGTAKPGRFCDEDCNHCCLPENRQFTLLANTMVEMFGFDKVYPVVQAICPNMTCCADCHIDDFCHVEGCEIVDEAERIAAVVKAGRKRMTRSRRRGCVDRDQPTGTPRVLRNGNAAEMREALEDISLGLDAKIGDCPGNLTAHEMAIRRRCRSVLAAHARNCDVYATLEDACSAWRDTSPVDKDGVIVMTFDEWLFATAKEGEGNGR